VGNTLAEFERSLADNLCYERGTTAESASTQDAYWTLAVTVRDRLADRRSRTAEANYQANPKFVYYLSAEYMLGRQLRQNAVYTGTADLARQAVARSGVSLEDLEALDVEPGLGNGGLGRLAACLLDSLATLDMPAVGYGIRYEYGIFKQIFEDGHQIEHPDDWTFYGNPWEFPAPDDRQVVGFYGHTEAVDDDQGGLRTRWVPGETVLGEPSHMLVPGYGTETVNIIRLWQARGGRESLDLTLFNDGRYAEAVEARMRSENLTKVLYPSDSTPAGRELRLKQQLLPGLLLIAGHHPPVPVPQPGLGGFPRPGRHPAQRHPPGAGHTRAHAPACRRKRGGLGAGVVHQPPYLRLHLSHTAARGSRDVASPDVRAAAAPPPGDHLRPQSLLPRRRARPVSGRR
jgi:starch phosphorylase